jgi:hypothetical protein
VTAPTPGPALSWAQEVLRLAERMRPGTVLDPRCVVRRAHAFAATPDLPTLERALADACARHDATRTTPFAAGSATGGLSPVVHPPAPVPLDVRDLSGAAAGPPLVEDPGGGLVDRLVADPAVVRAVAAAAHEPFDLTAAPLLRAAWLRRGTGGILLLVLHHWAGDAGALDVLGRDVAALYAAHRRGEPPPPPPPAYAELARSERATGIPSAEASLQWWRAELAGARRGVLPVTGPGRTPGGATSLLTRRLPDQAHRALLSLAAEHRASPYMVLLAAVGALLDDGRGDPGASDALVFSVDAARSRQARSVVGFWSEPVPLRLRLDRTLPFAEAVRAARRTVIGALSHRDVPFLGLLEASPRLAVALLRGRRPGTLLQYVTAPDLDLDGLRGVPLPTFPAASDGEAYPFVLPLDLDVTVERRGDAHWASVLYDPGLWGAEDVADMLTAAGEVLVRGSSGEPLEHLVRSAVPARAGASG